MKFWKLTRMQSYLSNKEKQKKKKRNKKLLPT